MVIVMSALTEVPTQPQQRVTQSRTAVSCLKRSCVTKRWPDKSSW